MTRVIVSWARDDGRGSVALALKKKGGDNRLFLILTENGGGDYLQKAPKILASIPYCVVYKRR